MKKNEGLTCIYCEHIRIHSRNPYLPPTIFDSSFCIEKSAKCNANNIPCDKFRIKSGLYINKEKKKEDL